MGHDPASGQMGRHVRLSCSSTASRMLICRPRSVAGGPARQQRAYAICASENLAFFIGPVDSCEAFTQGSFSVIVVFREHVRARIAPSGHVRAVPNGARQSQNESANADATDIQQRIDDASVSAASLAINASGAVRTETVSKALRYAEDFEKSTGQNGYRRRRFTRASRAHAFR